jgi:hypothetical protein
MRSARQQRDEDMTSDNLQIGAFSVPRSFTLSLLAVSLSLAVLVALPAAASAAGGTCLNEPIRQEQGEAALSLPECRAYEQVSPAGTEPFYTTFGLSSANVETGEGAIQGQAGGELAAANGNSFAFQSTVAPPGSVTDGPFYLARRGNSGWSTENLTPPQSSNPTNACLPHIDAWSPELTTSILADGRNTFTNACGADDPPLVAGEPRGVQNLFLRDSSGSYQLVNLTPEGVTAASAEYVASSPDLSHVVFRESALLTPDAPSVGAGENREGKDYYEYFAGSLKLVTILPNGLPSPGVVVEGGAPSGLSNTNTSLPIPQTRNVVSGDGERILWETQREVDGLVGPNALYLRLNAGRQPTADGQCSELEPELACTVRVDAAAGGNGEGEAAPVFRFSSVDGSRVFFTDEQNLTAGSNAAPGAPDLYEFELNPERPLFSSLVDLTANSPEPADVVGLAGISDDGSSVYFAATADLTGSETNSQGSSATAPAQGTGLAAGVVKAVGELRGSGDPTITGVDVTEGEFHLGQEILGEHIFAGTTIAACTPDCSAPSELKLSGPTEASNPIAGVAITGLGSAEITNVGAAPGTFEVGMALTGVSVAPGTAVTAVGPDSLSLSKGPLTNGTIDLEGTMVNLFRRSDGHDSYVATLAPALDDPAKDAEGDHCAWAEVPVRGSNFRKRTNCLTSRVSPDGNFLAFTSNRPLTGYDSTPSSPSDCVVEAQIAGQNVFDPEPCQEVFLYDASRASLECASCAPDGLPPIGPASIHLREQLFLPNQNPGLYSLPRNLSTNGAVFFDTKSALLPSDENGVSDVYEYSGGTLSLISSGKSASSSYFYEASESGQDVFFLTAQALVKADTGGEMSIYDARIDGGFSEPQPAAECEGEPCRGAATQPPGSTSAGTPGFSGPEEGPKKTQTTPCKKGSAKKHGKCVKKPSKPKHHKQQQQKKKKKKHSHKENGKQAGDNRRSGK